METITIAQNTPFRLINRIGNSDNNELSTLVEGELCYLADKKRMVVGTADGYEYISNKFYYLSGNNEIGSIAVNNDIVYNSSLSGFEYFNNGEFTPLNTTGNINYDKNIFTIDSSGLTIKPISGSYAAGKITAISVDKYGRINYVQTNSKPLDTYYNFISNTNSLNLSVIDNLNSQNSSSIDISPTTVSSINLSSFDIWFTYNFSNSGIANYNDYEWYPMSGESISNTLSGMGVTAIDDNDITNIILQIPRISENNTISYYLNNTIINANLYLTSNPL